MFKKLISTAVITGIMLSTSINAALGAEILPQGGEKYVTTVVNEKLMSVYSDGTFRPSELMTREKLARFIDATLIYRDSSLEGYDVSIDYSSNLTDVTESNFYFPYIASMYDKGIIKGFDDKTFKGTKTVTRGEALAMIVRAYSMLNGEDVTDFKSNPDAIETTHRFSDVTSSNGFYNVIYFAAGKNWIVKNNTFRVNDTITKYEIAVLLYRILLDDGAAVSETVDTPTTPSTTFYKGTKQTVTPKASLVKPSFVKLETPLSTAFNGAIPFLSKTGFTFNLNGTAYDNSKLSNVTLISKTSTNAVYGLVFSEDVLASGSTLKVAYNDTYVKLNEVSLTNNGTGSTSSGTTSTGSTSTGSTSTGSTSTGTTASTGSLSLTLVSGANGQFVPKNGTNINVGTVKFEATSGDVTINSLVVTRSGLGSASDIMTSNGVRAAQSGVVISSSSDYYNSTAQKATVYFSPALVVKAGTSQNVDLLVNLNGLENSQHKFTVTSVNVAGTSTVSNSTLDVGTISTTSYQTTSTKASLVVGSTAIPGKTSQLIAKLDLTAGNKETKVTGFTITRSGSTDFNKRLANVKVFKNGAIVSGATVSMTSDKINVNGLTDILQSGNTQTYEIRSDVLVDGSSTTLGLKIDSQSDIRAIETSTTYATSVNITNAAVNITFSNVEVSFVKLSTASQTVAPGTNNVKLFDAKLTSGVPLTVKSITITPTGSLSGGIDNFVNSTLSVRLNGSEIAELTTLSGASVKTTSFVVDSTEAATITIEGSISNNANLGHLTFSVALSDVRDSSNNTATIGAGQSISGDKTTLAVAAVELKNATVAAPATARLSSSTEQEVGRFALTARNEPTRVTKMTFAATTVGTGVTVQALSNGTATIKLVDVATNVQVSSVPSITGNDIVFDNMNDVIAKDITKNYKIMLSVGSLESYQGGTVNLGSPTITTVRDSNSATVTPTGTATLKTYTISTTPPTVIATAVNDQLFKVKITNIDTTSAITLTGVKLSVRTTNSTNGTYSGSACIRVLGSTDSCSTAGSSTAGQNVPGLSLSFDITSLTNGNFIADKNNGTVEFEVYMNSPYTLSSGAKLVLGVEGLTYNDGMTTSSESYLGVTSATATYTQP